MSASGSSSHRQSNLVSKVLAILDAYGGAKHGVGNAALGDRGWWMERIPMDPADRMVLREAPPDALRSFLRAAWD